jgi:hypothetical protein
MRETSSPTIVLRPCLLCKATTGLSLQSLEHMMEGLLAGVYVWCAPCQLRGPWRATEHEASVAWNRLVTVPYAEATPAVPKEET